MLGVVSYRKFSLLAVICYTFARMEQSGSQLHDKRMSLGDHLEELRRRLFLAMIGLVVSTAGCLFFGRELIQFLSAPYNQVIGDKGLAVLTVSAGISAYFKVSLLGGLIVASPWIFYQFWMFISAGLYPREKRYVNSSLPFAVLLFLAGAAFFYFVIAEQVLRFLLSFSESMGLEPVITLQSYISFITTMMVVMGLGFQTPLVILVLTRTGLVSRETLGHYRKHVIISILIVCAILTPPDIFSQLALAIPIWLLYEMGLFLSYLLVRRTKTNKQ